MLERLSYREGQHALVISPGRAQLAMHWAEQNWNIDVSAWYLDLYSAAQTARRLEKR